MSSRSNTRIRRNVERRIDQARRRRANPILGICRYRARAHEPTALRRFMFERGAIRIIHDHRLQLMTPSLCVQVSSRRRPSLCQRAFLRAARPSAGAPCSHRFPTQVPQPRHDATRRDGKAGGRCRAAAQQAADTAGSQLRACWGVCGESQPIRSAIKPGFFCVRFSPVLQRHCAP